jgi:hypothetical protein
LLVRFNGAPTRGLGWTVAAAPATANAGFNGGEGPHYQRLQRLRHPPARRRSRGRARAALDLGIAEGLAALRKDDRLARLGSHLGDYAREVLGIEARTALKLAHFASELRARPLLREAVRSGRVRFRAAQVVLPIAIGEAEAVWVERAAAETVRALEKAVEEAKGKPEADEEWGRLTVHCTPEEREVIDAALQVAGKELPGTQRFERLEAMGQEYLGEFPLEDEPTAGPSGVGSLFRVSRGSEALARRKAELESETNRWAMLEPVADAGAPEIDFDALTDAADIDARLRELARMQNGWDEIVGYRAHILQRSGIHLLLGFATFRQYVDERLGLPARAVEQRAALEGRMWQSPALREARRQKLSYEKLRALAHLPEKELASWVQRARTLTCIALRRELEAARERQMRARRKLCARAPLRVACLLADAIRSVRARVQRTIPDGACLAVIAAHFLRVHGLPAGPKTSSQRARARDDWHCTVPGCSRPATHSHHVLFLSHGGARTALSNQTGVCTYRHLRCIHPGHLRVYGEAPDGLGWLLGGKRFTGVRDEEEA